MLYWNGHRVMGVLAMSRAIGDHCLRPYVIPEPEVCAHRVCSAVCCMCWLVGSSCTTHQTVRQTGRHGWCLSCDSGVA